MRIQTQEKVIAPTQQGGGTFISMNPKRERELLDKFGNVIDPRTKQIIKKAEANN